MASLASSSSMGMISGGSSCSSTSLAFGFMALEEPRAGQAAAPARALGTTNIGPYTLHQLESMTQLDLSEEPIGDAGALDLAKVLKDNHTITHLNLDRTSIGIVGLRALGEAFKFNHTLTHVTLRGNNIGAAGAQALAAAFKVSDSIAQVDLSWNDIGVEGTQALTEMLKDNHTIVQLSLCKNNIGDVGAQALAAVFKVNQVITQVELRENNIGNVGAQALAEAFENNHTITQMDLSNNLVAGAEYLAAAEEEVHHAITRENVGHYFCPPRAYVLSGALWCREIENYIKRNTLEKIRNEIHGSFLHQSQDPYKDAIVPLLDNIIMSYVTLE